MIKAAHLPFSSSPKYSPKYKHHNSDLSAAKDDARPRRSTLLHENYLRSHKNQSGELRKEYQAFNIHHRARDELLTLCH